MAKRKPKKSPKQVPIGEALPGVSIHPVPHDGYDPDFVFVLARVRKGKKISWARRTNMDPNEEELLGALEAQCEILRRRLADTWA